MTLHLCVQICKGRELNIALVKVSIKSPLSFTYGWICYIIIERRIWTALALPTLPTSSSWPRQSATCLVQVFKKTRKKKEVTNQQMVTNHFPVSLGTQTTLPRRAAPPPRPPPATRPPTPASSRPWPTTAGTSSRWACTRPRRSARSSRTATTPASSAATGRSTPRGRRRSLCHYRPRVATGKQLI